MHRRLVEQLVTLSDQTPALWFSDRALGAAQPHKLLRLDCVTFASEGQPKPIKVPNYLCNSRAYRQ